MSRVRFKRKTKEFIQSLKKICKLLKVIIKVPYVNYQLRITYKFTEYFSNKYKRTEYDIGRKGWNSNGEFIVVNLFERAMKRIADIEIKYNSQKEILYLKEYKQAKNIIKTLLVIILINGSILIGYELIDKYYFKPQELIRQKNQMFYDRINKITESDKSL